MKHLALCFCLALVTVHLAGSCTDYAFNQGMWK